AHPSSRILGNERMGSGVIVDPSGLVLTVNYVVMGASTVDVGFLKGRRVKAEVVAQDFEVGLALVRVKRQGLTAVPLAGGTDLTCGEPVIAVASTGPQERRISGGLVTYLGEFEAYWEYLLEHGIVTSAQNPGFGGGGLFSMTAALLGVVYLNLNEIVRCSLAIPVDHYREHASELLRYGRVVSRPKRAWLGVFAHAVDEGVVVMGIVPEGPGDGGGQGHGQGVRAGLRRRGRARRHVRAHGERAEDRRRRGPVEHAGRGAGGPDGRHQEAGGGGARAAGDIAVGRRGRPRRERGRARARLLRGDVRRAVAAGVRALAAVRRTAGARGAARDAGEEVGPRADDPVGVGQAADAGPAAVQRRA